MRRRFTVARAVAVVAAVLGFTLPATATPALAADALWAVLYEHTNGGGAFFNVVGTAPCGGALINIPASFNDRTSSVRVLVPGCWIVLFEHANGQGISRRFDYANGGVVNVPLSINDKASSFT